MSTSGQQSLILIDWIKNNGVFDLIWDPKKTHMQLVQRSGEIIKAFLREDLLTEELLAMFWNLTKSEYKLEVYKIINSCDFLLEQQHMQYMYD